MLEYDSSEHEKIMENLPIENNYSLMGVQFEKQADFARRKIEMAADLRNARLFMSINTIPPWDHSGLFISFNRVVSQRAECVSSFCAETHQAKKNVVLTCLPLSFGELVRQ